MNLIINEDLFFLFKFIHQRWKSKHHLKVKGYMKAGRKWILRISLVYTFHNLKLRGRRKSRLITQKCGESGNLGAAATCSAANALEKC